MPSLAVILPAAGRSSRFGGGRNKLFEPLGDKLVLQHTIDAFVPRWYRDEVAMIVVTTPLRPDRWTDCPPELLRRLGLLPQGVVRLCEGGPSRAHSVLNALQAVPETVEWVAVHDAARPLVSQPLIDRTFAAAQQHGAAAPALPVALTIKQAAPPLPARVMRTVPRHDLFAMQTPQILRRTDLLAAYAACPIPLEQVTDDVQLLELCGKDVWLVEGEERNLKITTQLDLKLAELLLNESPRPLA